MIIDYKTLMKNKSDLTFRHIPWDECPSIVELSRLYEEGKVSPIMIKGSYLEHLTEDTHYLVDEDTYLMLKTLTREQKINKILK